MKSLLTSLVCILPLVASAAGLTIKATAAKIGTLTIPTQGGGSCPESPNISETTQGDYVAFGNATKMWAGEVWTNTTTTKAICQWDFYLLSVGGDTSARTVRCSVYTITGSPIALVDELGFATVSGINNASYGWVTFTFSTPVSVTNGVYAIVLSDGVTDGSDWFRIGINYQTGTLTDGFVGEWTGDKASYAAFLTSDACLKGYWQ